VYDETDVAVSDALQRAWTTFACDGVPRDRDGNPWPAATATAPQMTLIDDTVRAATLRPSPSPA
jgi:para-nitrobenzyl esterase